MNANDMQTYAKRAVQKLAAGAGTQEDHLLHGLGAPLRNGLAGFLSMGEATALLMVVGAQGEKIEELQARCNEAEATARAKHAQTVRIANALQPFVQHSTSEPTIKLTLSTEHIRRGRAALGALGDEEQAEPDEEVAIQACHAAIAYDKAIQAAAGDPEKMTGASTAEGDDLDTLYMTWQSMARRALGLEGPPKVVWIGMDLAADEMKEQGQ